MSIRDSIINDSFMLKAEYMKEGVHNTVSETIVRIIRV